MCGIYGYINFNSNEFHETFIQSLEVSKELNYRPWDLADTNYSVTTGQRSPIITMWDGVQESMFGYYRQHPNKPEDKPRYVFNIRTEGGWTNKENDPDYLGPWQIYGNPFAKEEIYARRCLIPISFFAEGPKDRNIKRRWLFYKDQYEPFYLGGLYTTSVDESTGEIRYSHCILTRPSMPETQRIDHPRSPLIIPKESADLWLHDQAKKEHLDGLFATKAEPMQLHEVEYEIARKKPNLEREDQKLIEPIAVL